MRRPLLTLFAAFGLILTACGSSSSPTQAGPITIGVSLSLTGDFSSDGKALQQGYDLWAADVNARGGLLGHHVNMKYVDDASSVQQVQTNYQNHSSEPIDWTPYAQAVAHSQADVVILGTQLPDALAFVKYFISHQYNPKTIIETTGPDQGADFSGKLGANTEGIMVPAGWTAAATAYGNDTFVSKFIAKFGGKASDISADAAEAYSVGQVVDQAATKANSIENAKLIDALHSGTYNTVQGPMSFDSTGKPQGGVGVYIEQWQGGEPVFAYPSSVAKKPPEYPKPAWH